MPQFFSFLKGISAQIGPDSNMPLFKEPEPTDVKNVVPPSGDCDKAMVEGGHKAPSTRSLSTKPKMPLRKPKEASLRPYYCYNCKTKAPFLCSNDSKVRWDLRITFRARSKQDFKPSKQNHAQYSWPEKKGKTLSLPLHAHSKHMGRRKVLLAQGIF